MKLNRHTCDGSRRAMILGAGAAVTLLIAGSAHAELLVYEPFDYPDGALNGNGGALGTTGVWSTNDTGFAQGWWCHPEGEVSGAITSGSPVAAEPNAFDGTVDNLPTSGGFAGMAGPEDQGAPAGIRKQTGNLDGNIGLDPSVTATFQSGTTTWFSYVAVRADDRNEGTPTLMLGTDPTTNGSRSLSMTNSGNGIGGGGGPPRRNLLDVYPTYFEGGVKKHSPGGYDYTEAQTTVCQPPRNAGIQGNGTFGLSDGIVECFGDGNDTTARDQLDENGQPRTQTMPFAELNPDGTFGAPGIIVGKIEWDADADGEDIISVVQFLETDELTEAAFDARIAALPALSSANWDSNKPDLDQSQFDLINISSLKFFVDEIRLGTTFGDVIRGGVPPRIPLQLRITTSGANLGIEWDSQPGKLYNLRSAADLSTPDPATWPFYDPDADGRFVEIAASPPTNTVSLPLPAELSRYFVVEEFPAPPVEVFSDDFESGEGLWTVGGDAGSDPFTQWEFGSPTLVGPAAANSGANCFGTNLSADYANDADLWLRSPAIDLTAATEATLSYSHFHDIEEGFDFGTVSVLDAEDDSVLAVIDDLIDGVTSDWEPVSTPIPTEGVGRVIKIEFRFQSDDISNFAGWYIDDVVVTTPAP